MYVEKLGKMEIHITHDLSNRDSVKKDNISKELTREPFLYTIIEKR